MREWNHSAIGLGFVAVCVGMAMIIQVGLKTASDVRAESQTAPNQAPETASSTEPPPDVAPGAGAWLDEINPPHVGLHPMGSPAASQEQQEAWAERCADHYIGRSPDDVEFGFDVTKKPLRAMIRFADMGSVIGQPAIAVGYGKIQVVDSQFKEVWVAVCEGNKVTLHLPPGDSPRVMTAQRSARALQIIGD